MTERSNKDLGWVKKFESADKEEFKRPDHNDFKTSSELAKDRFSGIRQNSLALTQELWVNGEIKISMAQARVKMDPDAWDREYAEVFGLYHVKSLNGKGN